MKSLLIGLMIITALCACDGKGPRDGTIERATAEGEALRNVDNKNQAEKAAKMEADLTLRHKFYSALEGKYEGDIATDIGPYKIRVTLVPSILPYKGERTRQLSEIENDLNNLFFYVQVVQWHNSSKDTAVGCRISSVKPNMNDGYIVIGSSECPNLYQVYISAPNVNVKKIGEQELWAKVLADQVRAGMAGKVTRITGSVQPTTNAAVYKFDALRAE